MKPNLLSSARAATVDLLDGLREGLRQRRASHVAYLDLRRELAAYQTPADIGDLMAVLDRQGDAPGAEQVRAILSDNLKDYRRRQRQPLSGS